MSAAYCPASEVILRHHEELAPYRLLFAGDLQDELAANFDAIHVQAISSYYHQWQHLKNKLTSEQLYFTLLAEPKLVKECDTLIYYWPKNKQEAQFQLTNLLSQLAVGCHIYIVGENRSGVRSIAQLFNQYCSWQKIDTARHCSLYYGQLEQQPHFALEDWWHEYQVDGLPIKTLPGVFSQDALDSGSKLLLSTLSELDIHGRVLDIGCGAGVLSTILAKKYPDISLTLTDTSAAAIMSSQENMRINHVAADVFAGNLFSEIKGRFDFIISNPPFHSGLHTDLNPVTQLIQQAPQHLQSNGSLYLVANAFLPYADLLDATFGNHEVLAKNSRYKVYHAKLKNNRLIPLAK